MANIDAIGEPVLVRELLTGLVFLAARAAGMRETRRAWTIELVGELESGPSGRGRQAFPHGIPAA
ncbi:hypothetical protein O1L55_30100 [Streptomyces albulus]|nr:hypothetical protein [Streptomyces noursei]